jgi:ribosomal protein S18 acetylase RimI-like enzyme
MNSIRIEKLRRADITNAYKFIQKNLMDFPLSPKHSRVHWAERFNPKYIADDLFWSEDYACVVAKSDGKIVGLVNAYLDSGLIWFSWLLVDKKFRRKGLGSQLMLAMEQIYKKKGYHKAVAETLPNNTRSNKLLRKIGYVIEAKLKKHYAKQDYFQWAKWL